MTAVLTIAGQDVSGAGFEATVQTGRDSLDSQPDATVLEASIRGWRPAGRLGDTVTLGDVHGMMFHGAITDLGAELDPHSGHWTVTMSAVGPLADLGRVVIGDVPWPSESDSQRVARILDTAGTPHAVNPNILGPILLPSDVDRQPALELAQDVAGDALGVLWEQPADPDTPIRYTPQRLRAWGAVVPTWSEIPATQTWADLPAGMTWDEWTTQHYGDVLTTPSLTLSAGVVVASVELSQQIGDLIGKVRITYGPEIEGSPRPQAVSGEGTPELSRDTRLADATSAAAVADSLWRARREPAWRLTAAELRLHAMPPSQVQTVRDSLAVGTKLTLTDIDFDSPLGATWQGYIEGWTHELDAERHILTLQVVDRRLIEPADRWQDISPTLRWQDISPTLRWQDATGGFD